MQYRIFIRLAEFFIEKKPFCFDEIKNRFD